MILDTKMNGTFEIMEKSFDFFLMGFFRVMNKSINHTNNKVNFRLTMSNIDSTTNQLSIKSSINYEFLIGFGKIYSRLEGSSRRLVISHLKMCK
jgi:hypothetical protein